MTVYTYTVENQFYADEAIAMAQAEGKTFQEMQGWARRNIRDFDLYAYFTERAGQVLKG